MRLFDFRLFGSFSYQDFILYKGEFEHRRVKRFYGRTNKNNAVHQITCLEMRERFLTDEFSNAVQSETVETRNTNLATHGRQNRRTRPEFSERRDVEQDSFSEGPYHISLSSNDYLYLRPWIHQNKDDPALKVRLLFRLLIISL